MHKLISYRVKYILIAVFLSLTLIFTHAFAANKAFLLNLNEAIGPAAQDYVERGIALANEQKANVIIIQLNTPGGLETSMRGINAAILKSSVPVITYVAPAGARAASAGIFIMYASHLALMAPGTNAGAASPISLTDNDSKQISTQHKKAMNDAAAYIRSLAQLRDRNAAWAELAVTQAASVSATEAKKINVINDIAADTNQLLQKIDGKSVSINGTKQVINTTQTTIETINTDWRHDLLSFITNPNIAYLLILLAMYGLFFELSNPGLILPGVAGVIALLLALYAMQLLPINYAGLSLLLIGITFMVMEIYITSYGALGIGGIIAFILGSVMLFDTPEVAFRISWSLIGVMSLLTAAFFVIVATMVIRAHKNAIITGKEGIIGHHGVVISVNNEQVIVRVLGELWEARSHEQLVPGDKIKVISISGLILSIASYSHYKGTRR